MKKVLKIVGIVLAVFIGIPLISALFISKDFDYETSITITSSADNVWHNVNSFHALDQWSPWNDYDPNIKKTFTGEDGVVGSTTSWESEVKKVGSGMQTITEVVPFESINMDIEFYTPYESKAKGYIKLLETGHETQVTWEVHSQIPYPLNFMNLWLDPEKELGEEFKKALNKLKVLCEE